MSKHGFLNDPVRISGTLRVEGTELHVQLEENPPGCAMVANMTGEGQTWRLEEPRPDWVGVGLATSKRTIIQPGPSEEVDREKPYLVEWDDTRVDQLGRLGTCLAGTE